MQNYKKELNDNTTREMDSKGIVASISIIIVLCIISHYIISLHYWIPFYYKTGIPIYKRRFKISKSFIKRRKRFFINPNDLNNRFTTLLRRKLVFKRIGSECIAFKEQYGWLPIFIPRIMHGTIIFSNEEEEIQIIGRLIWPNFFILLILIASVGVLIIIDFSEAFLSFLFLIPYIYFAYYNEKTAFRSLSNGLEERFGEES